MILTNWLESLTLDIFENATDEATNVCMDYWKMEGGEFVLNTDQILKKYDIENIHKLIFMVNTNSRFYHAKQCAESGCNSTHSFNSRSEFKAGISSSRLTRNFPYYEKNKYRKTTPIIELFEKEKWCCNKHTKVILEKRILKKEAKVSKVWSNIKSHLDKLLIQLEKHDMEVGRLIDYSDMAKQVAENDGRKPNEVESILSNRNYTQCFESEVYLKREQAWLFFCDFWLLNNENKWVYSEKYLAKKYKIKLHELNLIVEGSGIFMPLIMEKYTEEIIKTRDDYLDAVNDSSEPVRNDRDNLRKFNDSKELADKLREIAKGLNPGESYYLTESAEHIEGMFNHYKELVNRVN